MTLIALVSSIILSAASLAWGYAEVGLTFVSRWLLIFGTAWLFSQWRGWRWFSSLGLFVAILAAAFGLWFDFDPAWMISGAVFALFAWDMTDFRRRLHLMSIDDDTRGMERRHIARLSLLTFAGLLLITITMLIQLNFTFEWGVFLVVVILLGLVQLVSWFRRQGK